MCRRENGGFGFEQTKTYFEVRGFLKDIIAEDLDSAVENIWFFDNEENLENGTELSEEEAQNVSKSVSRHRKTANTQIISRIFPTESL